MRRGLFKPQWTKIGNMSETKEDPPCHVTRASLAATQDIGDVI
jgi:hypothetical protein